MSLNKAPASPGVKGEHQDADRCLRAVGSHCGRRQDIFCGAEPAVSLPLWCSGFDVGLPPAQPLSAPPGSAPSLAGRSQE